MSHLHSFPRSQIHTVEHTMLSKMGSQCGGAGVYVPETISFSLSLFFFFFKIHLFIFGVVGSVVAALGLSLAEASRGYSSLLGAGFSVQWLLLLWSTGSRCSGFSSCGSPALEHWLSSCDSQAWLLHGMWDLPRPGIKPVSLALQGELVTTGPPGKPPGYKFYHQVP